MMSSSGVKRSANSPLSDDEEKRHRVLGDSIVDDPDATFTGLVLLTLFLQDILSLALPCILIIFSKVVSFSKFPMHC